MKLDVVVPTYSRSHLLKKAISSLMKAPIPSGIEVTIVVVDNNSKDDTEQVVRQMQPNAPLTITYIKEINQGSSQARNAGIISSNADVLGFIDDDEEIDENWYNVIAREFKDPSTLFIGGPCLGNWSAPSPSWLPPGYHSAIGVIPAKPRSSFSGTFQGNLMGGNSVIRRSVFDIVGLYSTKLGRSGKGLLSEEDAEFFRRLRKSQIHGMYVPDLIIYHYIPEERLTRKYHRRWCYWRGVSQGLSDRDIKEPVRYLLGIPLYRIGRAIRGMLSLPKHLFITRKANLAFADELASWDVLGFIYGKYFINIEKYYRKQS